MIKNRLNLSVIATLFFFSFTTSLFAQGAKQSFFQDLVENILSPLLGLVSMGALVYFLFGVMRYFIDKDQNEDARTKLKAHLAWGLIGLFIIFSIGGIVSLVSSFGGGFE
jgi:NhaP-type Na+/H+ or K+/H+ antiporter